MKGLRNLLVFDRFALVGRDRGFVGAAGITTVELDQMADRAPALQLAGCRGELDVVDHDER